MNDCVKQALKELQHIFPKQVYLGPSKMIRPDYGQKIQYIRIDSTDPLTGPEITFKQKAVGKFLFYARAINNTILHSLNDIATMPHTKASIEAVKYFLNYAPCNPDAKIIYQKSNMVLQADSDAAYLVCPKPRAAPEGTTS